jgi:hypothetical protein
VPHLDPGDGGGAAQLAAAPLEPAYERLGEAAGAAFRHGPAVLLPQRGEQPAHEAARRRVEAEVGVQRAAGEQQRAPVAAERLGCQPAHGQGGEAREWQEPLRSQAQREPQAGAHRRER